MDWLFKIFEFLGKYGLNLMMFILPYFLTILITHLIKINVQVFSSEHGWILVLLLNAVNSFLWNHISALYYGYGKYVVNYLAFSLLCFSMSAIIVMIISKANKTGLTELIFEFIKNKLGGKKE